MNYMQLASNLYAIPLDGVNAFLIDSDELILIDTGIPDSAEKILSVVHQINRKPEELQHILVTHCHPDHAGSLAELKRLTGASAYMHPIDAVVSRVGIIPELKLKATPGMEEMFDRFIGNGGAVYEGAEIEYEVNDGEELPLAGGMRAIHVPGHSAGQLAFLWEKHKGVLFAADTSSNMMGLNYHLGYEDYELGKESLRQITTLNFEVACFGHGDAILKDASSQFRKKWGRE